MYAASLRTSQQAASHVDYGFEYSDEDVEEEDVDIENQYYNSKGVNLATSLQSLINLSDQVSKGADMH